MDYKDGRSLARQDPACTMGVTRDAISFKFIYIFIQIIINYLLDKTYLINIYLFIVKINIIFIDKMDFKGNIL